jgi:hypothetical protein
VCVVVWFDIVEWLKRHELLLKWFGLREWDAAEDLVERGRMLDWGLLKWQSKVVLICFINSDYSVFEVAPLNVFYWLENSLWYWIEPISSDKHFFTHNLSKIISFKRLRFCDINIDLLGSIQVIEDVSKITLDVTVPQERSPMVKKQLLVLSGPSCGNSASRFLALFEKCYLNQRIDQRQIVADR